jgi:hypothetical protein
MEGVDTIQMIGKNVRMRGRSATVKKTYNLPPALVSRAKRILKVRTETEAIVRSLEEVAFMDEVARAVRATGGRIPGFQLPK